jgi:hypothetical protein
VELTDRFFVSEGFGPNIYGDAWTWMSMVEGSPYLRQFYVPHPNDSGYIPVAGDVVVMGRTTDDQWGHVGVVSGVIGNDVYIVQQNSSGPAAILPLSGSHLVGEWGLPVTGVIHAIKNTGPAPPTLPAPTTGQGVTTVSTGGGGGSAFSSPAVLAQPNGSPSVFFEGPGNSIVNDYYVAGQPQPWTSVTLPGEAFSSPAVLAQPNGSPSVFFEGPGNSIVNDYYVAGQPQPWVSTTLPGHGS